MNALRALDRLFVPIDASPAEHALCWAIYLIAGAFSIGGLWAYVSVVLETLGPFRLRVRWPREIQALRDLGVAMLTPFRR